MIFIEMLLLLAEKLQNIIYLTALKDILYQLEKFMTTYLPGYTINLRYMIKGQISPIAVSGLYSENI